MGCTFSSQKHKGEETSTNGKGDLANGSREWISNPSADPSQLKKQSTACVSHTRHQQPCRLGSADHARPSSFCATPVGISRSAYSCRLCCCRSVKPNLRVGLWLSHLAGNPSLSSTSDIQPVQSKVTRACADHFRNGSRTVFTLEMFTHQAESDTLHPLKAKSSQVGLRGPCCCTTFLQAAGSW